jgi:hypothetical protein
MGSDIFLLKRGWYGHETIYYYTVISKIKFAFVTFRRCFTWNFFQKTVFRTKHFYVAYGTSLSWGSIFVLYHHKILNFYLWISTYSILKKNIGPNSISRLCYFLGSINSFPHRKKNLKIDLLYLLYNVHISWMARRRGKIWQVRHTHIASECNLLTFNAEYH